MPNPFFFPILLCFAKTNSLLSHFHSKEWLRNKHFPLIWGETCQIINKYKEDSYLRTPVGMNNKTQRKIIVLEDSDKWKIKDFNWIYVNKNNLQ